MDNNKNWIDQRFPLTKVWNEHLAEYYTPRNFNFWYFFGSLAMLVLVMQIVTGIFLTMHFKPDELKAFASVEYIMRDVNWGWLIRYLHSTGASAFFIVIYLHMYRGLLYGSYKSPRELIWILGMVLYIALMAEAFMGYVLPWGQMSYWGAKVIISLFGSVPLIGPDLLVWILGDYAVGDPALNRFFSLHVIALPLILVILVFLHIVALHTVGSNNPDGVEIKKNKDKNGIPKDGIPFHPYYSVKDIVGVVVFLMIFSAVVFFAPAMNGYFLEHANFIEANPLKTPEHIAPLWYLTPFYSVLRAIPPMFNSQFPGVVGMFSALLILLALPWLDRSKVKSIRYRSWPYKVALGVFVVSFITLGWLGMEPVTKTNSILARVFTVIYFGFFILMPWFTSIGKTKEVPKRVTGK
ncbi:cytochrome b [bacterium endosymbiont of Bathymodiolus sp. 5 South]|jgi:ubiquinol-cytochrome c reductase cytochrome b subunit|uniref:cytochrome b n=1 Tax=bacterium endosymbiont of Bathymodiolus sp. 5 South TaxID=1181670 RepID=UPI0010BA2FDF|nr:cytochrome b N-terminal domain-containing protein [bacterium endosymbiont of Bathymodiolus sp. 5 South]CAC9466022.1 Ubiquinol-cytochrome C reductase, cytochrome B subunit (EC 1.10.2.2) [uncultured Gammaproteobacteria bacterium]SHN89973.1 Ubiquinol-cytochrome C reductase, cytochrome B subunit [bacterium endosymbiont of Bathymodiolus sp. 5 South]SSC08014.1 Ubiquinol--cytochrome c reductase, cytochrome B subunit [bacterium endosymbiont of Bathymodiolus sp. 5 South]VVH57408.1 Ubiquinol--cytochro